MNPLGAGKGRFKLVELYWTLADIPKKYRSKVDSIQLGVVVQEKLLKKYGYARIYKPLLEDMLKLEREYKTINRYESIKSRRGMKKVMTIHIILTELKQGRPTGKLRG